MTLLKNCRGQLTIFFGILMVLLITVMAFVVNVGLYVKAKINLQNAVDSAAWAGAAVQSRQLTTIAYLNWEMRNVYKEWMFKYYVLGQSGIPNVENPDNNSGDSMDFRMSTLGNNNTTRDKFNVPSVCIHFQGSHNICKIYHIPGLPRFENVGLPDLDQTHNAFLDQIVMSKAGNCAQRSKINFETAMVWAYGIFDGVNTFTDAPQIASNRTGAWPKALELALRIRNLEYIMNEKPKNNGVCLGNTPGCGTNIQSLENLNVANHERTIKAFYSAWRNLGNNIDREMKDSFVLTELTPLSLALSDHHNVSMLLVPGGVAYEKYYVDLRLFLLNLATFYTMFVTATDPASGNEFFQGNEGQAACSATKTAIPIPSYPFGFDKNPAVLTYYAVKGEAQFTGLFNPFNGGVTKLTAYSAAKPFGGRIGPRLFRAENTFIKPRESNNRSRQYLSTLRFNTNEFRIGSPIPINTTTEKFWVDDGNDTVVGGHPSSSLGNITFAIPNLIYELVNMTGGQVAGNTKVQVIEDGTLGDTGLHDKAQFKFFRDNLPSTGVISPDNVEQAILQVRAPTHYEAINYLIPHMENGNQLHNTAPYVFLENNNPTLEIWAPLIGEGNLLYNNMGDVEAALADLMDNSTGAVLAYTNALKAVATKIREQAPANNTTLYEQSANQIWDGPNLTCRSIAGKFSSFYTGNPAPSGAGCNVTLKETITHYWNNQPSGFRQFHREKFRAPTQGLNGQGLNLDNFFTAYMPGPLSGNSEDGVFTHPFLPQPPQNMRRNTYSTKFVPLNNLSASSSEGYNNSAATIYSEGSNSRNTEDLSIQIANLLDPSEVDFQTITQ